MPPMAAPLERKLRPETTSSDTDGHKMETATTALQSDNKREVSPTLEDGEINEDEAYDADLDDADNADDLDDVDNADDLDETDSDEIQPYLHKRVHELKTGRPHRRGRTHRHASDAGHAADHSIANANAVHAYNTHALNQSHQAAQGEYAREPFGFPSALASAAELQARVEWPETVGGNPCVDRLRWQIVEISQVVRVAEQYVRSGGRNDDVLEQLLASTKGAIDGVNAWVEEARRYQMHVARFAQRFFAPTAATTSSAVPDHRADAYKWRLDRCNSIRVGMHVIHQTFAAEMKVLVDVKDELDSLKEFTDNWWLQLEVLTTWLAHHAKVCSKSNEMCRLPGYCDDGRAKAAHIIHMLHGDCDMEF